MKDLIWEPFGVPAPVKEYRFDTVRRYRFDYAWPDKMIAVEIEGGVWNRGAHVRGKHYISDCEKYNLATSFGWQVYRFVPRQLKTGEAQNFISKVMRNKTNDTII